MVRNYIKKKTKNNRSLHSFLRSSQNEVSSEDQDTAGTSSTSNQDTAAGTSEPNQQDTSISDIPTDDRADVEIITLTSDEDCVTPPRPKKQKIAGRRGAANYLSRFQSSWIQEFDFVGAARDDHHFRCMPCGTDVSCGHMGRTDITRHSKTKGHLAAVKRNDDRAQKRFETQTTDPLIMAELRAANLIVQSNQPMLFGDNLGAFIRTNFNEKFTSGRTKMTSVIGCLADDCREKLVRKMKSGPYSIYTDGSNDNGLKKMMPITISVEDDDKELGISNEFLDICMTETSTAEGMYNAMVGVFHEHDIPLENCVSIAVDNTNANVGNNNSLKTRLTAVNPSIYTSGCVCHMIHNAASHGAGKLQELNFDVEGLLTDIYGHFNNSTPKKQKLVEFCEFVQTEYRVILKHVRTRWLSLNSVIQRTLEMYEALRSYFSSTNQKDAQSTRLKKSFNDPMTEVYLMCIASFTKCLATSNQKLQTSTPQIHRLRKECTDLVLICLQRFTEVDSGIDLIDLDMDNLIRREGSALGVGFAARQRIMQLRSAEEILETDINKFYRDMAVFFEVTTSYLLSHLPINNSFLAEVEWVEPRSRLSTDDVMSCALRYRKVFKYTDDELDNLEDIAQLLPRSYGDANFPQNNQNPVVY